MDYLIEEGKGERKRRLTDQGIDIDSLHRNMEHSMADMENRINSNMSAALKNLHDMIAQLSMQQGNHLGVNIGQKKNPREILLKAISEHPFKNNRTWGNKTWLEANEKAQFKPWMKHTKDHIEMYWGVDVENMGADIEKLIMATLVNAMSNTPARWYETWRNSMEDSGDSITWPSFCEAAKKRWEDPIFELTNMVELLSIPRCNGNVRKFNDMFKAKVDVINDIDQHLSEKMQKALYYSKMNDSQRNTIGLISQETLAKWMNKVEMQTEQTKQDPPRKHCYKCGGNHLANECKSNEDKIKKHTENCKRCKQRRVQLEQNTRERGTM
jgi:hypothetical protein